MKKIRELYSRHTETGQQLQQGVDELKILQAKQLMNSWQPKTLNQAEFQVFSQWGDDGIIQYLLDIICVSNQQFIEFGVETYTESNTRFLLMNDNWSGFVIDGSSDNIQHIQKDRISWRYDLQSLCAFITKENINQLMDASGFGNRIGLLSVDIDGNDYWIWQTIDSLESDIVIVEYNAVFGHEQPVSIPYDPRFRRSKAHSSNLFWGASLAALEHLGKQKGYRLVGTNTSGNNAYFVNEDLDCPLKTLTSSEAFHDSKFRESRDEDGNLSFLRGRERLEVIGDCEVVNIKTMKTHKIRDVIN
jgi:hypothetical protein